MKRLSILFTILVIFSSTLVSPISCTKNNGVALFVFGDSLFDPGNNNYLNGSMQGPSNSWPYGESYFKQPTGRLSDGRLVPDFIEIHGLGGKKFAFQNVGALGCVPSMLANSSGGGWIDGASSLGRLHNRRLSEVLGKLQTRLPGFKYSIFDYYNSISERVNNPSKHGFKEGKSACCGSGAYRAGFNCGKGMLGKDYEPCSNPKEYVWFDAGHTTESANLQLATLLWNGTSSVIAPHNLKQFYEQL